jgi:hypothetical protein
MIFDACTQLNIIFRSLEHVARRANGELVLAHEHSAEQRMNDRVPGTGSRHSPCAERFAIERRSTSGCNQT